MIEYPASDLQLANKIKQAFSELKVLNHLKRAGFQKNLGCICLYLFWLVFLLTFHHKNWYRLLESGKGELVPGKDTVYRFLNHLGFGWRKFLLSLSASTVQKVSALTETKAICA